MTFIAMPLLKSRRISLSYLTGPGSNTNASSYTFSSVSMGDEASDRCIIVIVSCDQGAANTYSESITVGGSSATLVSRYNLSTRSLSMYRIDYPTGTTADVVITLGTTVGSCRILVYRLVGATSNTPVDSGQTNTGLAAITFTKDMPANSVVLMAASADGITGTSHTWSGTGFTSPATVTAGSGLSRTSAARDERVEAGTSLTFTATFSTSPGFHRAVIGIWA